MNRFFTIDVEEWFHILDSPVVPDVCQWKYLESRVCNSIENILKSLDYLEVNTTMFWLGWAAERNPDLVKLCAKAGHEIASHGYAHVLAFEVGREKFREDIRRGKAILEDIIGEPVKGFRAAGFSTTNDTTWTFEEIRAAGYIYDSSVFPTSRGHGGMSDSDIKPHIINTPSGPLVEMPQSVINIFGKRISLFGGGYLRLAPFWMIEWGIHQLEKAGRPLIIYVHPREIDPDHPRLPLSPLRYFKSYVNLRSTMPKLEKICKSRNFIRMDEYVARMKANSQ